MQNKCQDMIIFYFLSRLKAFCKVKNPIVILFVSVHACFIYFSLLEIFLFSIHIFQ